MRFVIFVALLVSIASVFCKPLQDGSSSKDAVITDYDFYRGSGNEYRFGFKTSDGTAREEVGKNDENDKLKVNGTVSWISQDGSTYYMYFKADKWGFRPIIKRIPPPNLPNIII